MGFESGIALAPVDPAVALLQRTAWTLDGKSLILPEQSGATRLTEPV